MGETAGFTSQRLQEMASQLQRESLFGDEEILGKVTANLLTFGNVQGEVFERAQQAALDLSARLGTDLQSSTIQLGKALNEPVEGITALTRVGVSFTEQQEDQIRAMAEAGDVAGAQAAILAELERQYAGQARALAELDSGAITQSLNAIGDALEDIGAIVLPVMADLARGVQSAAEAFQQLDPDVQRWVVGAGAVAAAVGPLLVAAGLVVKSIAALAPILALFTGPIGLAIAGVAAAAALVIANWDKVTETFETVSETVRNAWTALETRTKEAVQQFKGWLAGIPEALADLGRDLYQGALEIGTQLIDGIKAGLARKATELRDSVRGLGDNITGWAKDALGIQSPSRVFAEIGDDTVQGLVVGIDRSTPEALAAARSLGEALGAAASDGIKGSLDSLVDQLAAGNLRGGFRGFFDDLRTQGTQALSGMFKDALSGGGLSAITGGLGKALGGVTSGLGSLFSGGGLKALGSTLSAAVPLIGAAQFLGQAFAKRITDSGIKGQFGPDGFTGERFQKTSRFFGLLKGGSSKALEDEIAGPLGDAFDRMRADVEAMAAQVGEGSAALEDFTFKFKVSTKGLSESEALAALDAELGRATDAMADLVLGTEAFARPGETAGATLARLAGDLTAVNEVSAALGFELRNVSLEGANAASSFVQLFGTLQDFQQVTGFFFENFYTAAERLDTQARALVGTLTELGVNAIPATRAEFRALVDELMSAGQEAAAASVMQLAPAFVSLEQLAASVAEDMARQTASVTRTAQASQQAVSRSATRTSDNLRRRLDRDRARIEGHFDAILDGLQEALGAAEGRVQTTRDAFGALSAAAGARAAPEEAQRAALAAARATLEGFRAAGRIDDVEALRDALDVVAEPSEDLFQSLTDYRRDFARTSALIGQLLGQTEGQLTTEEQTVQLLEAQIAQAGASRDAQLAALDAQLARMTDVADEVATVRTAVDSGRTATVSAISSQVQATNIMKEALLSALNQGFSTSVSGGSDPSVGTSGGSTAGAGRNDGAPPNSTIYSGVLAAVGAPSVDGRWVYDTASEILQGASAAGVSTAGRTGTQIVQAIGHVLAARGITPTSARFSDASLATRRFATGGFAPGLRAGALSIVGEQGIEARLEGPARYYSRDDTRKLLGSDGVVTEVAAMRADMGARLGRLEQMAAQRTRHAQDTRDILEAFDVAGLPPERS
jgi:hypothetical protein